jgi:hypothetical protein
MTPNDTPLFTAEHMQAMKEVRKNLEGGDSPDLRGTRSSPPEATNAPVIPSDPASRAAGQPDEARVAAHTIVEKIRRSDYRRDFIASSSDCADLLEAFRCAAEAKAVAEATKELRAQLSAARTTICDLFDAADDLGIHPAAWITADGVRTERTERQSGYNDAVMQLGAAMDLIASRAGVSTDEDDRKTEPWCWTKPLEELRAQLAAAEAERDALAKKLSDQSMSVIMDCDEFDAIETKAKRCEAAEARCKELAMQRNLIEGRVIDVRDRAAMLANTAQEEKECAVGREIIIICSRILAPFSFDAAASAKREEG